jgi:hypothetical protein
MSRVMIELALLRIDVSVLINAANRAASISPRSPERQIQGTDAEGKSSKNNDTSLLSLIFIDL